jgi:hypothetical protein
VRLFRFAPIVICALVAMADAATAASTFLPPVGQTARYRFSDTVIGGKGTKTLSGSLTLLSVTEDRAQLSIAIDGKAPRTFNLHVDATGALDAEKGISAAVSPTDSRAGGQALPGVAEQALILQLSLASRAGAHPADVESFPVLLDIPWAGRRSTPYSRSGRPARTPLRETRRTRLPSTRLAGTASTSCVTERSPWG